MGIHSGLAMVLFASAVFLVIADAADMAIYPIQHIPTQGETIRETYFSIRGRFRSLGIPPDSFWGSESIDFLFQTAPDKIGVSYKKGTSPPKSASRTALTQVIPTKAIDSVKMHSELKEIIHFWFGIIGFFLGLFIILGFVGFALGKLGRDDKKSLAAMVVVFLFIGCLVYVTGSYNYVHFDNANDGDCILRVKGKDIALPGRSHVKLSLDCGPIPVEVCSKDRQITSQPGSIEVARSDLLVYNIFGSNTYVVERATYVRPR